MSVSKKGGLAESPTKPQDDFSVFVPGETKISTLSGEEVTVPIISWGKERKILEQISELLDVISRSGILQGRTPADDAMSDLLTFIFKAAPEKMTTACMILLDKDEDWINNQLTSEVIVDLLLPFLRSKQNALTAVLAKHLTPMISKAQTPTS